METDLYTNVLSHYEDNASHSDSDVESQDSWAEGEAPEQIKGLTLDEDQKAVEAEEMRQKSDIRELLPEGDDDDGCYEDDEYDVGISNDDDNYNDDAGQRSMKEYEQEVEDDDEASGLKVPELLEHPTVDITRDPSISSRISSDIDIFSTRTPTTSLQQTLPESPNFQQFIDKNQFKTRTSTMTSTVTSQFQPPNNMNQFVNNAGYSQSIYSTDTGDDDMVSQYSYLPNDDKPWEMGYNPPKIPISKVQTTNTVGSSSAESLMKFQSQLNHNRQAFSNNEDIISTDQQSVTTIDEENHDDDDATDHEGECASIIDNRTLKSEDTSTHNDEADDSHLSTSTATTADIGSSQLKKIISKTSATNNNEFYSKSVIPIIQAKTSNSQKITKIKELRLEQSKHDTMLSNWLITQTELAKSTVSTRQADLGPNVKTALNTKYTGGSPMVPNAGIGLGYGISAGLDSTKSKVADVGEGLHRGMQSLGRVAKGFVGSESGPKHLFRRRDSRRQGL